MQQNSSTGIGWSVPAGAACPSVAAVMLLVVGLA